MLKSLLANLLKEKVGTQPIAHKNSSSMRLGDMKKSMQSLDPPCNAEFRLGFVETYTRLLARFGRAICEEKGISAMEAENLSLETEFTSEEVKKAFEELKVWLTQQKEMSSHI